MIWDVGARLQLVDEDKVRSLREKERIPGIGKKPKQFVAVTKVVSSVL